MPMKKLDGAIIWKSLRIYLLEIDVWYLSVKVVDPKVYVRWILTKLVIAYNRSHPDMKYEDLLDTRCSNWDQWSRFFQQPLHTTWRNKSQITWCLGHLEDTLLLKCELILSLYICWHKFHQWPKIVIFISILGQGLKDS